MSLNFTFNNWSPTCKGMRESCIRYIAAHEFGHALGFAHEHNRPDRPATCTEPAQGGNGDITLGSWDLSSIMNYCNPVWNNNGALSTGDIAGARQFYGSPTFATLRRDAIDLGKGKIYFFNGGQYTRYDRALDRADSGYPRPILGNWTGWPAAFTAVDAALRIGGKVYFFKGSQYIRFDIGADKVDLGPKPILGNWDSWVYAYGDKMGGVPVPIGLVEVGKEVEVSVNFKAPDQIGEYTSAWQMANSKGVTFGKAIFVKIVVK